MQPSYRPGVMLLLGLALVSALGTRSSAQSELVLHIRYNPTSPAASDRIHIVLLPRRPWQPGFVAPTGQLGQASIDVGPGFPSDPGYVRDSLIASLNAAGLSARVDRPDVLTILSGQDLTLGLRSDNELVGAAPGDVRLLAFERGIGGVADGIPGSNPACRNQADGDPLPYQGGGFCFLEHLPNILHGEGNARDLRLRSRIDAGPWDSLDKPLSVQTAMSLELTVDSPGGSLNSAPVFLVACFTDRWVSHSITLPPELDLIGVHRSALLILGGGVGVLPGSPTAGASPLVTIPLQPGAVAGLGMSLVAQALAPDPGSANGIVAVSENIRHDFIL